MKEIIYEQLETCNDIGIDQCILALRQVNGSSGDTAPHWHLGLEITYLAEGAVRYTAAGEEFLAPQGDFVFVNSGVVHATRNADPDRRITAAVIVIPDTYFAALMPDCSHPQFTVPEEGTVRDLIAQDLREIMEELLAPHKYGRLLLRSCLERLIFDLFENCCAGERGDSGVLPLCHEIMDHVMRNYGHDLSNESVAARFGLSEAYFGRLFKKQTCMTFHRYVSMVRLGAALALMREGSTALTCAVEVGFGSEKVLIDWCRKIYGCTPKQYLQSREQKNSGPLGA